MRTTLTTSTTFMFLKRPHPHSVFILCAWYTIWVSILIKSIVLSLFLAFITLSDLYFPHHPPSEGCTFRSWKKGILYILNSWTAVFDLWYNVILLIRLLPVMEIVVQEPTLLTLLWMLASFLQSARMDASTPRWV